MKKQWVAIFLCVVMLFSMIVIPTSALSLDEDVPQTVQGTNEPLALTFIPARSSYYRITMTSTIPCMFSIMDSAKDVISSGAVEDSAETIVWMDKGYEYSCSIVAPEASVTISVQDIAFEIGAGNTYETDIGEQEITWLSVTPPRRALYSIRSIGDIDAYAMLYDDAGNQMDVQDDVEDDVNFLLEHWLEADATYYCGIGLFDSASSGTVMFEVTIKQYYPDVKSGTWYTEPAHYLLERDIMTGFSTGMFGPAKKMQRQDFVLMLARMVGADLSAYESENGGFPDVQVGSYYAPAVAWAVDNGVISGYMNGKFGVGDALTREQLATIFWRYNGSPEVDQAVLDNYPDRGRVSDFAVSAMAWAVNRGIISGMSDGQLSPTTIASRAQVATIIWRMLTTEESQPETPPSEESEV